MSKVVLKKKLTLIEYKIKTVVFKAFFDLRHAFIYFRGTIC